MLKESDHLNLESNNGFTLESPQSTDNGKVRDSQPLFSQEILIATFESLMTQRKKLEREIKTDPSNEQLKSELKVVNAKIGRVVELGRVGRQNYSESSIDQQLNGADNFGVLMTRNDIRTTDGYVVKRSKSVTDRQIQELVTVPNEQRLPFLINMINRDMIDCRNSIEQNQQRLRSNITDEERNGLEENIQDLQERVEFYEDQLEALNELSTMARGLNR